MSILLIFSEEERVLLIFLEEEREIEEERTVRLRTADGVCRPCGVSNSTEFSNSTGFRHDAFCRPIVGLSACLVVFLTALSQPGDGQLACLTAPSGLMDLVRCHLSGAAATIGSLQRHL